MSKVTVYFVVGELHSSLSFLGNDPPQPSVEFDASEFQRFFVFYPPNRIRLSHKLGRNKMARRLFELLDVRQVGVTSGSGGRESEPLSRKPKFCLNARYSTLNHSHQPI